MKTKFPRLEEKGQNYVGLSQESFDLTMTGCIWQKLKQSLRDLLNGDSKSF